LPPTFTDASGGTWNTEELLQWFDENLGDRWGRERLDNWGEKGRDDQVLALRRMLATAEKGGLVKTNKSYDKIIRSGVAAKLDLTAAQLERRKLWADRRRNSPRRNSTQKKLLAQYIYDRALYGLDDPTSGQLLEYLRTQTEDRRVHAGSMENLMGTMSGDKRFIALGWDNKVRQQRWGLSEP